MFWKIHLPLKLCDYFPVMYYIYNNFRIKFERMVEELGNA